MIIPLGTNDTVLTSEDISRIRLRNMYLVNNPFSPDGVARVSRPTLSVLEEVGAGPINGIWQQDGSIGNRWLIVSGESLYSYIGGTTSFLGTVPGSGLVAFAGNIVKALILRDGLVYSTDGTNLLPVAMPDDQLVQSVACIDSVFILTILASQVFYWMLPTESTPDALSFASAERTPDGIVGVGVVSDEIWFLGSFSVEVWQTTSNQDAPYQRIAGRVYGEGCASRDTVCVSSYNGYPCIVWVTDKKTVVLAQGNPSKISNATIEEFLRDSENLRAWIFRSNKNTFYVLTSDTGTYVYDLDMKTWCRWDSFGRNNWKTHLGIQVGDSVYGGDISSGKIFKLEEGVSDDGDPVIREVSGFVSHSGKHVKCSSVNVRVNSGYSDSYLEEPILEMRWSDDYGVTWTDYTQISLGSMGQYYKDVTARSLGMLYRPGREFEFRFSDLDRFRIDYATINEV